MERKRGKIERVDCADATDASLSLNVMGAKIAKFAKGEVIFGKPKDFNSGSPLKKSIVPIIWTKKYCFREPLFKF